jgi:8-oxo-dGTP pyrophosphatase MutT (NUDIX family)
MANHRLTRATLPLQVAAVCYRRRGVEIEFLLVNTTRGKWTFPKGDPEPHLSHSQAAQTEALEEAGVIGVAEPRHFQLYIHSKGVFWQPRGVQEFVVKAFLLEVERIVAAREAGRNPTWFNAVEAKRALQKGREVKYSNELQTVVDCALERIRARRNRLALTR